MGMHKNVAKGFIFVQLRNSRLDLKMFSSKLEFCVPFAPMRSMEATEDIRGIVLCSWRVVSDHKKLPYPQTNVLKFRILSDTRLARAEPLSGRNNFSNSGYVCPAL